MKSIIKLVLSLSFQKVFAATEPEPAPGAAVDLRQPHEPAPPPAGAEPQRKKARFSFMRPHEPAAPRAETLYEKVEMAVDNYLTSEPMPEDDPQTPIEFWATAPPCRAAFRKVALSVMNIPASSSGPERAFSQAGCISRPDRLRLKAERFEKLMLQRCNRHLSN